MSKEIQRNKKESVILTLDRYDEVCQTIDDINKNECFDNPELEKQVKAQHHGHKKMLIEEISGIATEEGDFNEVEKRLTEEDLELKEELDNKKNKWINKRISMKV